MKQTLFSGLKNFINHKVEKAKFKSILNVYGIVMIMTPMGDE